MVIHEWEDGTKLYTDEFGQYKLDYDGISHDLTITRTGVGTVVLADDSVPKDLLAEIGANL